MDLPTYTSIWRIEKRLYKLYDFRLPMPLPIGQITVFAAIAIPYVVLLTLLGVPFNHSLIWLYVLPPGVATWLVTRPVLEGKRLPELIRSQLRYVAEPRVWCRMAPLAEKDVIIVTGRVWRLSAAARERLEAPRAAMSRTRARPLASGPVLGRAGRSRVHAAADPVARDHAGVFTRPRLPAEALAGLLAPPASQPPVADRPPAQPRPVRAPTAPPTRPARPHQQVPYQSPAEPGLAEYRLAGDDRHVDEGGPDDRRAAGDRGAARPAVTVVGNSQPAEPPPSVERALAGPSARRGDLRSGRVTVVPGGHRPGKPDQLQRDRVRAQRPIEGQRRVVVLGCTVGAGQTITALLAGELLASLRSDLVAVLDLNPGPGSLAHRAQRRPALSQAASLGPSRLAILAGGGDGARAPHADPAAAAIAFSQASVRHQIVLADPSTSAVPRLLAIADQLVLVAPASGTAARAIGMTFEWLDAHGQGSLASGAIMVMNGVSRRSAAHVEHAERVCAGQCRAMVRVPWDDQLANHSVERIRPATPATMAAPQWAGLLSPATAGAYTALAGVLVAALAESAADQGRAVR